MKSEYVPLDDPRVTAKSTWPGRVYRLDGPETHPDFVFPHEVHSDGRHVEPRMNSVMAPFKTWNYAGRTVPRYGAFEITRTWQV